MAEREYYDDWMNLGDDPTGGQAPPPPSDSREAPMGLSFWNARGYPNNKIFGPNGQLLPGWTRTEQGYMYEPPIVNPAPPAGGGDLSYSGGFSGGGMGGDWGYLTEPFTGKPPAWQSGPIFQPPTFQTPPPFSYKQYQAPTKDSIYADPSYEFRAGEGRRALEQSAAGQGILRTGGTLKDLVNYGQNAASQEYSNIFDRSVQAHNLGLNQELGTYATNYGVSRDAYDRLYEGNKATFEGQQRDNLMMNQRDFDNFLASFDIFEKNRRRTGDYLTLGAGMGG